QLVIVNVTVRHGVTPSLSYGLSALSGKTIWRSKLFEGSLSTIARVCASSQQPPLLARILP
ncbi:MAG: hypothetical protein VYA36_00260, partial [Pseudomonadota bacterium]|nr:hypothetical protein [Pseudomonadota bacterium]